MKQILLLLALILFSNLLSGQSENDITTFSKKLDQFYNIRDFCISNNGNEAYFTIQSPSGEISQIATLKKEGNKWLEPELLPFCDEFMYLEPFLTPDQNRLFFVSDRPINNSSIQKKDFDIWYVDKDTINNSWSKPKNLGKPVNSSLDEFYPTVSSNNNLYFTMASPNGLGKDDIYFCEWKLGKYKEPVLLNKNINSDGYEFNAFISKNEDFLLFTKYNTVDGQGSGDLYISKKDKNNNWAKATNLGLPINTKYMEYCPFYDEENQKLYFTSKRKNIKTQDFKTVLDFKNYIKESKNGLSKIYVAKLNIIKN
ncbi:TolB-like translocation protein [Cellulophaga omnivescoria]|uniref:hypothetical protein n=1 Tax=Cellulophaga omnivescoria TaxID=1888890 RepID=UPI0022F0DAF4|nr:hypothetical protein [Cellulophaga omnivescoria]WBU87975.1 hypothetical protein PBN93_08820 [Cellulophaga omnivescoria]